jgi:hypothetical protein
MAEQLPPRFVRLTREELYEKVWQSAMIHVAAELGISGNGLAKICDRHKIPYPPRGYWAKKAAGKKVVRYRLPDIQDETLSLIVITRTPGPRPIPQDVKERLENAQSTLTVIEVPEKLTRPHPIIAAWLASREEKKRKSRQERDPIMKRMYDPGELTELDHRRHRILDALFKALQARGMKLSGSDRGELFAEAEGEKIEFAIREKQKQIRRAPNDQEKKDPFFGSYRKVVQQLQPTGRLLLAIKTYLPQGMKGEWLEPDDEPLES